MTHEVRIRDASGDDAEALAEVYNHYIRTSTVTFDTELKTAEERREWLAARDIRHPVIVAEENGRVLGYAVLSGWAVRPAWRHTAEAGVYVRPEVTGRGIGAALLAGLIGRARTAGMHALIAQIVSDNSASIAVFERAGFRRVGTLEQVGRKFDRWLDVDLLELVLEPAGEEADT